jgi:RNA polymerase sigma-70 factor (ECF subfamily)
MPPTPTDVDWKPPGTIVNIVGFLMTKAGIHETIRCNEKARFTEVMDVRSSEPELRTLMMAGLDGDAAAHKNLLERLSSQLRGYFKGQLSRINRGPAEAEDLVQEALIAIHTRRHTYDPSQLFTPWVYAIARYKFVDYLRRTKASTSDLPIEDVEEIAAQDDRAHVESTLDLERLMAGLSPRMRQAIQYVKIEGLSVSEAATRCGMSESNVKVSVHRGLRALALQIRKERA